MPLLLVLGYPIWEGFMGRADKRGEVSVFINGGCLDLRLGIFFLKVHSFK